MELKTATKKITPSLKQQECIQALDGPVMVLAGPGTGKTFTVIQRLQYMLSKGIEPETILCLTFSETAAAEMKSRLVSQVGDVAKDVDVSTYHAFCNDVILKFPNQFNMDEGVALVDDVTAYCLMRDIFEELKPKHLKTQKGDIYDYVKPAISAVGEIKKTRTTKEQYYNNFRKLSYQGLSREDYLEDKKNKEEKGKPLTKKIINGLAKIDELEAKADETWKVYEIYTKRLKEKNYIDYNDMINYVLDEFESDKIFLQGVASKYKYFLVDEYQDTNFSQNQLVFQLARGSSSNNVFVVGDDDQIIFGFQGAQSDNLEKFLMHFSDARVICLDENRRSTQNILDFSYRIMCQDEQRLENNPDFSQFNISKKLTAKSEAVMAKNSPIKLFKFDDIDKEKYFIVSEIAKIIQNGQVDLSQIGILVNKNDEAREIAELLKSVGVDSQLKKDKSIFDVEASICLIFYIKALLNPDLHADKLFGLLLCEPFDFHPKDYAFLLEKSRKNKQNFVFNIEQNKNYSWANPESISGFISVYNELKANIFAGSLMDVLTNIIEKIDLMQTYSKVLNNAENIAAIEKITSEAQSFQNLNKSANIVEFMAHFDIAMKEQIEILIETPEDVQNAVQVMTLHSSKGREFEYVFMCGMRADKWEKKRTLSNNIQTPVNKTSFDKKSELLRLMFVGITRAKHSLYLTFALKENDKKDPLSEYINSVCQNDDLIDFRKIDVDKLGFANNTNECLPKLKFDYKKDFSDDLLKDLEKFPLSASSLNDYLDCPRKFLYSRIYKIPVLDSDKKLLNYGSAIHSSLEFATDEALRTGNYPKVEEVIENFSSGLSQMPIVNPIDMEALLQRGQDALQKFYPFFCSTGVDKLFAIEHKIGKIQVEDAIIIGQMDRVEKNNDDSYSIYDYKIGNAKSGKLKDKQLNQLCFYYLAFEMKGYPVSQAGIIYVEDFEKNYIVQMAESDKNMIKDKILDVHNQIQKLEFAPVCPRQNNESCKRCIYKMLCKLNVI